MSLIIATHYVYTYGEGHSPRETRRFGTLRAAQLWAESVLEPVVTTNGCYWRDVARGGHVDLTRVRNKPASHHSFWRRSMAPAGHIEAPVHIVQSVGELGWTP